MMKVYNCPQCGLATVTLNEGYCDICCNENQIYLNRFTEQFNEWNKLTPEEQDILIYNQVIK